MTKKSRLIQWLDEARADMRSAIKGINPETEICPGWSLQDLIGHITGWEVVVQRALEAYLKSEEPFLMPTKEIDVHNDDMVKARKEMTFVQVIEEWEGAREALRKSIMKLSEQDLEAQIVFPWGEEGHVKEMLELIANHEGEHLQEDLR